MSGANQTRVDSVLPSITGLPHMPVTRFVCDETTVPADYTFAINGLKANTYIMAELLDSYYLNWGPFKNPAGQPNGAGTKAYGDRAKAFVQLHGGKVDLWEIGNEVNGNWTGPYADVGAKIGVAYDAVHGQGKKSALTLWYNDNCGNGPGELSPEAFTTAHVPARVRGTAGSSTVPGVDYVFVSFYETECTGGRPNVATWKTFFQSLHALYPNAKLGFGEIGLPFDIDKWNSNTSNNTPGEGFTAAKSIADFYYKLGPLMNLSYYVGGYFYWYFQEDCVPKTKTFPPSNLSMWNVLHADMI
jgi:hypothetical protein